MHADGSFVITKHPGTGGLVSVGHGDRAAALRDRRCRAISIPTRRRASTRIQLEQEGPDRVLVRGVKGEPPPPTTKVCINYLGGYKN